MSSGLEKVASKVGPIAIPFITGHPIAAAVLAGVLIAGYCQDKKSREKKTQTEDKK